MNKEPNTKKMWKFAIVMIIIFSVFSIMNMQNNKSKEFSKDNTSYTQFLADVRDKKIKEVIIVESVGVKELRIIKSENGADKKYSIDAPKDVNLVPELEKNDVIVRAVPPKEESMFWTILISWFPMILFIAIWIYFMKKSMGGGGKGGMFGFGKSKAVIVEKTNVTFDDVVGCEEAKEEVMEVVDFLKNPEKYGKLGAKIPKGVLLTGPAGTGKTTLAKAIAHEANVPFFSASGSSFVEMFVGVGAARVRDMFIEAKKQSPCILFIDEIDALGGKRGNNFGGGTDEREQTLNQLLTEMDGVEGNTGVIVIGATNRPDMLDPALLRPGRLDRQVVVALPDVKGREQILKVHSKNVPIDVNLNLSKIAKGTPGFSGADLANLVNEAAIFASRKNKKFVDQYDFESAKDKIIMGPERRSIIMPEKERTNTAYHESGHAIVAKMIPDADPVHKVTIIPRGRALGVTMQLPEGDKYSHDREHLYDQIAILMGGRLAEEIFLNHMTTGASNDIERATDLARRMVTEWGMSEKLGPIAYGDRTNNGFLGGGSSNMQYLSPETLREVDHEVRSIVDGQYKRAKNLLEQNRHRVEAMAKALLEIETIEDWHIENIMRDLPFNHGEAARLAELQENKVNEEAPITPEPTLVNG